MAQQSNQQWGDANLVKPAGENSNTLSTPVIGDGNAPPQALVAQPPPFILLNTSAATHRAEDPPFYPGAASSPLTVMSFPPPPPPPPAFLPNTTQSNIPHGAAALSHTHVVMPGHAPIHAHQQHHHHHLHHHHHAHQHSVYAAATSPLFNVLYPFVQTAPHSHPSLVHQVAAQHHSPAAHGVPTFHPFPPPAGLTLPSATGPQQQLGAVLVNTESTSVPPSHTGGHHQSSGPRQLMITFLDPEVTNAELHAAFAVIGPLDAARVIYDKVSGKSKCFGFVYYHFAKDAATAMQCMSGHPIRGKRIKVIFASPQRPLPPTDM